MTASLFSPVRLGAIDLPHRIVMAPMTRNRSPGAVPTAMNALYYAQRASAALIVTEGTAPSAGGQGYMDVPGLYTDEQVQGWRRVTDAVHAAGGRIFAQLMHVGRVSHPDFLGGAQPVGPSAVCAEGNAITYEGLKPFVTPRALEAAEIEAIVAQHGEAARRAVEAGFDGVEIHGANGYLAEQFLASSTNKRTDEWGGSVERRARFVLALADAAAAAIGPERVGVRLSPGNSFNDIADADPQATLTHMAAELGRRGLAYLHLVVHPLDFDVLGLARSLYGGTLIANSGYDLDKAERDIGSGRADLVSFGAPFIANPDLPRRLRTGAPLAAGDRATFYGGDAHGYVDYPFLAPESEAA
jgi:N-ethylmaleimide reductase